MRYRQPLFIARTLDCSVVAFRQAKMLSHIAFWHLETCRLHRAMSAFRVTGKTCIMLSSCQFW